MLLKLSTYLQDEVRELATRFALPNKDRKDSQGICFLGKIKFSEFVARHIGEMEGVILEAETGDFLGKHHGFWFYTIGQRQGLRLPGGPWYVVEKDIKNNVVFVSRNYYSVDKRRRVFRVGSLKWLSGLPSEDVSDLQCKTKLGVTESSLPDIVAKRPLTYDHLGTCLSWGHSEFPDRLELLQVRHGPSFYRCSLTMECGGDGQGDVAVVQLSEDDQGLAAGQFAAFYRGTTCIGSGVILESWDDKGFPICEKALEIARMEDKSKLGKPVKIKVKPVALADRVDTDEKARHINASTMSNEREEAQPQVSGSPSVSWVQQLKQKFWQLF
ncbi:hypothetical protein Cgig2_006414 [Carnegiea gigantea]|uniref:tRNA-5-taurinomethyluridine 2-sulfurtransferase n=1 Tax=Carnegiea gigantea TaxID=171969 RepID=A0A9Q1GKS6_9CARY|nr:hypothetical protein Cgig2_006414 [Carnegiea gigantea]